MISLGISDTCFNRIAAAGVTTSIANFTLSLESGAEYTDGQYVWESADSVAGHKFLYRLDYAFAGVGYKLAGRSTYTNVAGSNKGSYNMTFEKGHMDYVLTRHKKSTYSDEHYVQRNSAIVKVTPLDEPDRVAYAPQNNLQFHTIDKGH